MGLYDAPLTPYPIAPESLPPSPRPVVFTAQARWMRGLFWAGLLLLPNVILYLGYLFTADLRALADHGQVVTGQVVGKRSQAGGRGGMTYHIRYWFTKDGRQWTSESEVSHKEFKALAEGASCNVTFLPEQPGTNCLGEAGPRLDRLNQVTLFLAVGAALLFGSFVLACEYSLGREKWLAKHGVAVAGWITSRDKKASNVGNNRRPAYWVHYRFTGPKDRRVDSWAYVTEDAWEYLFPQTPATILYDPENPSRSLPLCAFRYVCFLPAEETAQTCSPVNEERTAD